MKIAVHAPPDKGRANSAIVELLAKELGISKSSIELISGHTSRNKKFRIEGVTRQEIEKLADGQPE